MKKYILLSLFFSYCFLLHAQETVSIGPGYAQETYYSLANGVMASQVNDDWDLAFQIEGFAASIQINAAKGLELRKVPNLDQSAWAQVDTAGMNAWELVYNSDANWNLGAFNQGIENGNDFDLGWGVYNSLNHAVTGDSIFVLTFTDGSVKKLKIDQLLSGVYSFSFANLDGTEAYTRALAKADFAGKAFGYYAFAQDSVIDREPLNADWDLLFHRYIAELGPGIFYGVSGVQTNAGLTVAEVRDIDLSIVSLSDTANGFSSDISTIGYDWKSVDFMTGAWDIQDSLTYFVKARDGEIYQLNFTSFGGSANGDFGFSKSNLTTSIESEITGLSQFQIFPNPCGERLNVLFELEKPSQTKLLISDLQGRTLHQLNLGSIQGLQQIQLHSLGLSPGLYTVQLEMEGKRISQKLIVR